MARPHIEPFCDRDVGFKNMNLGGFGAGMAWLTLGVMKLNERSGVSAIVNIDLTTAFICDVTSIC